MRQNVNPYFTSMRRRVTLQPFAEKGAGWLAICGCLIHLEIPPTHSAVAHCGILTQG